MAAFANGLSNPGGLPNERLGIKLALTQAKVVVLFLVY